MNYYAFTTDETTELLGDFPDISACMDHESSNTVWVLSEASLFDMRYQINQLLT